MSKSGDQKAVKRRAGEALANASYHLCVAVLLFSGLCRRASSLLLGVPSEEEEHSDERPKRRLRLLVVPRGLGGDLLGERKRGVAGSGRLAKGQLKSGRKLRNKGHQGIVEGSKGTLEGYLTGGKAKAVANAGA